MLPRDIQINILGKCDIETRIKGGIIGRLNVPNDLQANISRCIHLPRCYEFGLGQKFYMWRLGRDDDHPTMYWVYTIIKEVDYKDRVTISVYDRCCHYLISDNPA